MNAVGQPHGPAPNVTVDCHLYFRMGGRVFYRSDEHQKVRTHLRDLDYLSIEPQTHADISGVTIGNVHARH